MSTVALVALARPTFDLGCAQANFDSARALLEELGATVVGPAKLVMTVDDVAAVTLPDADLHILFMASFSDASPAVELLGKVKGPVLGWSMREPGEVGERLKLNSMCGVNLAAHALMNVGQSIQLGNGSGGGMLAATDATSGGMTKPPANIQNTTTTVDSQSTSAYSGNSGKQNVGKMLPASGAVVATTAPVTAPSSAISDPTSNGGPVSSWKWPTEGKTIDSFSASEGGNKGIDIAGSRGQPIFATANGRVVYAGNALRGYGNLIIIKHNDDYLSAYAHNDTMLVREQEEVKAGQKIATMGSTGTSSVRLHFEIRYKGKSVNPLRYLPQR